MVDASVFVWGDCTVVCQDRMTISIQVGAAALISVFKFCEVKSLTINIIAQTENPNRQQFAHEPQQQRHAAQKRGDMQKLIKCAKSERA